MAEAVAQVHDDNWWMQEYAADASRDFLSYCTFVRGLLPAAHHHVIAERLCLPEEGGNGDQYELILGPPDTAKTEYGVMYGEWKLGRDPNYRWLVGSEVVSGIAAQIVDQMAETITNNERYHLTFGVLRRSTVGVGYSFSLQKYISYEQARLRHLQPTPRPPFPWLSDRGRRPSLRGANVKAVGWRTGYTGVRADGIIGDDMVSDRSSRSQVVTQTVYNTLHQKMLARLSGKKRRAILFGQRWTPRDLYGRLMENGVVCYDNNPHLEGLEVLRRGVEED